MAYKYKIDKSVLDKFFLTETPPTQEQLNELGKVFNVVMIKHFSSYVNMSEDLKSFALLAVLQRRKGYDPSFSSYNYVYSIMRNEIGNNINKLTRETFVEDILKFKERLVESGEADLPSEVNRYKDYLTGEKEFNFIRIPKKDALNLIIFLRLFESRRDIKVPDFIEPSKKSIHVLYKLLKEFFENGESESGCSESC